MDKILLLDNYDSFTFNLYHLVQKHYRGQVVVLRDHDINKTQLNEFKALIISPGPGRPETTPVSMELIKILHGSVPILGVCLGMQCLNAFFGGETIETGHPIHGKQDLITVETDSLLFQKVPKEFNIARYHSLSIDISPRLTVTAHTKDNTVMALEDKTQKIFGVQFHPESFLSEYGDEIIINFLRCLDE